jgi:hypothetical protein
VTDDNSKATRDDVGRADDEGRPLFPYVCEQCGEVMFWGILGPGHKPSEGSTLVIDHRMRYPATHQGTE